MDEFTLDRFMLDAHNLMQDQPPWPRNGQSWFGSIAWKQPRSTNRVGLQVLVTSDQDIQRHLWPTSFEIEFLSERRRPLNTERRWLAQHNAITCQMIPFEHSVSSQENFNRFRVLSWLVLNENVYVVGKGALAGEQVKRMFLLFPVKGDGSSLAAVVFPETGVPELPPSRR
ncbi:uncharacterized protein FOMMEDRAFT_156352 [Fomitiporia mediterranea MF3/22]|uniref:uncharacterized protein n=1 Tax=Fomitiporia mediterranea (strain MF3/22) TaxID=694068 RepID=UPI0004409BA9|nr:uncharacterized protein FOMMEDRAFT_156352 [Fomitiporia mediterranea MF3/22]EJD02995.1 hypothetical protein FOMMEDRAFT_156352 [Fomitiporia mediterranea MF3/22]